MKKKIDPAKSYRNWTLYYVLSGNKESAVENLALAVKAGFNDGKWIREEPALASIRNDSRYTEIVNYLLDRVK